MTHTGQIGRFSTAAILVAAAIALGYLLAGVPNVEGISAVGFFAGYRLGAGPGAVIGGLSMGIFSLFNPLGPPLVHVLGAQVVGMGIIGASGDLWRRLAPKTRFGIFLAGALGAVLTFLYGVLVDYGFAVSIGRWREPVPVIVAGLPFSVVHVVSNGLIFAGVGAFLLRRAKSSVRKDNV